MSTYVQHLLAETRRALDELSEAQFRADQGIEEAGHEVTVCRIVVAALARQLTEELEVSHDRA